MKNDLRDLDGTRPQTCDNHIPPPPKPKNKKKNPNLKILSAGKMRAQQSLHFQFLSIKAKLVLFSIKYK